MLAVSDADPNVLVPALLVSVPATIAAISSLRTSRKIKTNAGKDIGQHVEIISEQTWEMGRQLNEHEHKFGEVLRGQERIRTNTNAKAAAIIHRVEDMDARGTSAFQKFLEERGTNEPIE